MRSLSVFALSLFLHFAPLMASVSVPRSRDTDQLTTSSQAKRLPPYVSDENPKKRQRHNDPTDFESNYFHFTLKPTKQTVGFDQNGNLKVEFFVDRRGPEQGGAGQATADHFKTPYPNPKRSQSVPKKKVKSHYVDTKQQFADHAPLASHSPRSFFFDSGAEYENVLGVEYS